MPIRWATEAEMEESCAVRDLICSSLSNDTSLARSSFDILSEFDKREGLERGGPRNDCCWDCDDRGVKSKLATVGEAALNTRSGDPVLSISYSL